MHQEGRRVAAAASWVRISGGVGKAITVQDVGGSVLLGMRDGGSGSNGDDIFGSDGGKGFVSSREDVSSVGVHSWTSLPGEFCGSMEPSRALRGVRHKGRPGNSGV